MEGYSVSRRYLSINTHVNNSQNIADGGTGTSVLSSDEVYKTIILPLTSVAFIPVLLVCDGSDEGTGRHAPSPLLAIQDTKLMLDYFEEQDKLGLLSAAGVVSPMGPLFPPDAQVTFASMVMELLADEWLVIQAMYWRWGKENFEQQGKFVEYEFGSSSKPGNADYEDTARIAQKASRPRPDLRSSHVSILTREF